MGVDLAWGPRGTTGLCALDGRGRVLESARAHSDDEICDWLRPHLAGEVVVAVDAPLVVENDTGCRPCERVVAGVFGHRSAAAHPSSRSRLWFADGGRARHLADRLSLSVDPTLIPGAPLRSMIEVYPHTAVVCLFGLAATVKYKAKKGRTLESRSGAFRRLVDLLETLAVCAPALHLRSSPYWRALVAEVAGARSGAVLDRAEDEIDAYICAYVARYYVHWGRRRCAVIGDLADGYIVTPVDEDARRRLAARGGGATSSSR